MLEHKVKPTIRNNRQSFLTAGVISQHDIARPHTTQLLRDKLQEMVWEVFPHLAYSQDSTPSDFYLFGPLKDALRGKRFASNEEVKEAVKKWFWDQPKELISNGMGKLQER